MPATICDYVSFGDTHYGCKLGLMPPQVRADFDIEVRQSPAQQVVYEWFREFHDEFVPWATGGRPYALVHGGDIIDGVHHRSTTQVTHDLAAQEDIAVSDLEPMVGRAAAFFCLAGTPVHAGASWASEKRIAGRLGSQLVPGSETQRVHPELRFRIGDAVIHDTHHVSSTGLQKSMPTGITSDAIEQFITAAKAGDPDTPSVFLRHHCHHASLTGGFMAGDQWWHAMTIPGWQLKGPYPWKVGARNHLTHFGGGVVRWVTNPWGTGHVELIPFTRGTKPTKPIIVQATGGTPDGYVEGTEPGAG